MSLKKILFPEKDRSIPGERIIRTVVRTAHIAAVAVLVGGHFFNIPAEQLECPLHLVIITGSIFMLLELYGSFNWLFQVRGLLTLLKLALVLLIPFFWEIRVWILMTVLVIGSVGSHASSKVRYYSILTGKPASHKKG